MTNSPAAGVARLILLTLAAAGFLAMHGVAATDSVGLHHSPISMSATAMAHPTPSTDGMAPDEPAPTEMAAASSPSKGSNGHDATTACLFVLLSVLAGVALHALRGGLGATPPVLLTSVWGRRNSPRAPPRPVFLSLCVFRL